MATSFVATPDPRMEPGDIRVHWYEHNEDPDEGRYVAWLGTDVRLHLIPADACDLVAKLTAAMAERGDLPDEAAVEAAKAAAAADARAAAATAEARQWAELGQGVKAVAE